MIIGVGTDIIELEKVNNIIENESFMRKYFTSNELEYILSKSTKETKIESAGALFSGKEAVSKAIGTGFRGFSPIDIEIIHLDNLKPVVKLSDKSQQIALDIGIRRVDISLSHSKKYAIAFAVAQGDDTI